MCTQDDNLTPTPNPDDVEPKDPTPSVDYGKQFEELNSKIDELSKKNDELSKKIKDMEGKKENDKANIKFKTYY